MLDSVVLGDDSLERAHFVDIAHEGGLGIVELDLELCESGCGGQCGLIRGILGGGRSNRR